MKALRRRAPVVDGCVTLNYCSHSLPAGDGGVQVQPALGGEAMGCVPLVWKPKTACTLAAVTGAAVGQLACTRSCTRVQQLGSASILSPTADVSFMWLGLSGLKKWTSIY